jgi:hypothetical protein
MKVSIWRLFLFLLIFPCLPVFAKGTKESSVSGNYPQSFSENAFSEPINAYFFYEELCANCHDDEAKFISILQGELSAAERDQYPHYFQIINIYEISGRVIYEQVTGDLGLDRELLELPFLVLGGRIFQGYDSISANIREAYLTAAEDLFVYNRPYNPRTKKTGSNLFDDYPVNRENATIVYFYRITCPECAKVTPIIDALPDTVIIDGRERPLDIIRINTRSGNNGERIAAFFEAWQVPDKDRMVPIVFSSDSYMAGIEAISSGIDQHIKKQSVPWKLLP